MQKINIEVSARHCHLSRKDLDVLFGKDYELTLYKKLSQIDQFASNEVISIKNSGGQIDNVRVLGPLRGQTQVEISLTDAKKLKINPPIRLSGDLDGSDGCILIGPKGSVTLEEGVIIAKRHIHCDPETAETMGLKNQQIVSVKIGGVRSVIFENVEVRISDKFVFYLHIDTDEGNTSLAEDNQEGLLITNENAGM